MAEEMQAETEKADATIKPGDIVEMDVDVWIKESGKLHQTTNKELAQEGGIYDEKGVYAPIFLILGRSRVLPGLEKSILSSKVGETAEVEVGPEEGAGQRDPSLVRLYSIHEFERMDVEPRVGTDVRIGDRTGRITQVTVGRVRVDFNNPLAGHTLKYKYTVHRKVNEPLHKVKAIIEMHYGTDAGFDVKLEGNVAQIVIPQRAMLDQKWLSCKLRVVSDIYDTVGADEVDFVERNVKVQPSTQPSPSAGNANGTEGAQTEAGKAEQGVDPGRVA